MYRQRWYLTSDGCSTLRVSAQVLTLSAHGFHVVGPYVAEVVVELLLLRIVMERAETHETLSTLLLVPDENQIEHKYIQEVQDCLRRSHANSGKPYRIAWSGARWPVDVEMMPAYENEPFQPCHRQILVVGTSLGNPEYSPLIPLSVRRNMIILRLRNADPPIVYYGYARAKYLRNEPETWESDVDLDCCHGVLLVLKFLLLLKCPSHIDLLGVSAGVHQILSVLAQLPRLWDRMEYTGYSRTPNSCLNRLTVRYLVCCAGAWHPRIYDAALKVLVASRSTVLVHHHQRDTLCPWPKIQRFWETQLRGRPTVGVHLLALQDNSDIFGKAYHDVCSSLLGCIAFWDVLRSTSATSLEKPDMLEQIRRWVCHRTAPDAS